MRISEEAAYSESKLLGQAEKVEGRAVTESDISGELNIRYGQANNPKYTKDFEEVNGKVITNPTIQESGNIKLTPGKEYIWTVNTDGNLIVGEEVAVNGGKLGHPTLTGGGPSRISGELRYDYVNNQWIMNNKSGRYSFRADQGMSNMNNAAGAFSKEGIDVKIDFKK